MNPGLQHRVTRHAYEECGGRVLNEVPIQIELPLDIVISRRGKTCRQATKKDWERIARREIRGVDGIHIHRHRNPHQIDRA
ncbi:hypothetical protein NSND_61672 [Nitrospira sp. ND1]|nr:hypothetical protein NSND_61672 [Nitrospira sp. ND1]